MSTRRYLKLGYFSVILFSIVVFICVIEVVSGVVSVSKFEDRLDRHNRVVYLNNNPFFNAILQPYKEQPNKEPDSPDWVDFHVKAPNFTNFGVVAVIQKLYLRTNTTSGHENSYWDETNSTTMNDNCIDFMQFRHANGQEMSPQICGFLDGKDGNLYPTDLHGPRIYFEPSGYLILRFFVNPEVSISKDSPQIEAEVSVTAVTICPETVPRKSSQAKLKRCSQVHNMSCIPAPLFCNGKIDCGFEDEFGADENSCSHSKVVIGLLVVFLLLIFYCLSVWFQKYYSRRRNN